MPTKVTLVVSGSDAGQSDTVILVESFDEYLNITRLPAVSVNTILLAWAQATVRADLARWPTREEVDENYDD